MKLKPADSRRYMHMTVTREYLLRIIDGSPDEWRNIVSGAHTREEAREFIANGPKIHPLGPCEGFDYETGICPGHDKR